VDDVRSGRKIRACSEEGLRLVQYRHEISAGQWEFLEKRITFVA